MDEPGGILAVFAHPDDEVLGPGGCLARYADQGKPVRLLCATRGEVGEIAPGVDATPETLPRVREAELRDACAILGIPAPILLDYRDSGMAGTPENSDPRCLHMADIGRVADEVAGVMRQLRPRVVITFGPDGGYGHPDHIAIHQATVGAFDQLSAERGAASAGAWPEKLYYVAIPRSLRLRMQAEIAARNPQAEPPPDDPTRRGVPDDEITTIVEVGTYADRKVRARQAHRSQTPPTNLFATLSPDVMQELFAREYFVRARPVERPDEQETDLFA